jgi:hypothetical protein
MPPAPSTNTHEPRKVYFSRSEALKVLECSKHWLRIWTAYLGLNEASKAHVRYTVEDLNRLAIIRKTNTPAKFDRVNYMRRYMKKYREMGKGKHVKKFAPTAQKNFGK